MSRVIVPDSQASQEQDEPENSEADLSQDEAAHQEASTPNAVEILTRNLDADVFVYSGDLEREGAERFLEVAEYADHRENAVLVLSTAGGDPDAAYIIARCLQRRYEHFTLYVFGYCKSAGTLLALGADEIVMSDGSEFGPLDIQLVKADELLFRSSGLDIMEALDAIGDYAFNIFEKQFIQILAKSSGAVSTKTAGEIATAIAVGLLAPITEQIDPLKLGEMQRSIRIALDYGIRLRANPNKVLKLVTDYSSHSFVIDFDEACDIFGNVREPDELERQMEKELLVWFKEQTEHGCIRTPHPDGIIAAYFKPDEENDDGIQEEVPEEEHGDQAE